MIPVIISNRFLGIFDAKAFMFFILIKESFIQDLPLIAHEKEHIKQQWMFPGIWFLLYNFSKTFRKIMEVKAHKVQIALGGISKNEAAKRLANNYGLDITAEEAIEYLKK